MSSDLITGIIVGAALSLGFMILVILDFRHRIEEGLTMGKKEPELWIVYVSMTPESKPLTKPVAFRLGSEDDLLSLAGIVIEKINHNAQLLAPDHQAEWHKAWRFSVPQESNHPKLGRITGTSWKYINLINPTEMEDEPA